MMFWRNAEDRVLGLRLELMAGGLISTLFSGLFPVYFILELLHVLAPWSPAYLLSSLTGHGGASWLGSCLLYFVAVCAWEALVGQVITDEQATETLPY